MVYVRITVFITVSICIIQQVRKEKIFFSKTCILFLIVNYRHEQDIYVRMIDSVTKQV
jgi:hypothetical protein